MQKHTTLNLRMLVYALFAVGFAVGLFLFLYAGTAKAETNTATNTSSTVRQDLRQIRTEAKNQIRDVRSQTGSTSEEKRAEIKEIRQNTLSALKRERVKAYAERMIRRLNAAADRIEKMQQRLDSRITKIKAAGGNTTESESLLASSKVKLADARASIGDITNAVNAIVTLENPPSGIPKLKEAAKNTENKLKMAHQDLVKAIAALKGMSSANATSTKPNTTSTTTSN